MRKLAREAIIFALLVATIGMFVTLDRPSLLLDSLLRRTLCGFYSCAAL
jgi:hypothetical protein